MTEAVTPTQHADRQMDCPTCHARQNWSDECRRCKCDLSLAHRLWRFGRQLHTACLRHLQAGDLASARACALRYRVWGGEDALRLLAACDLLAGNWQPAVSQARASLAARPMTSDQG